VACHSTIAKDKPAEVKGSYAIYGSQPGAGAALIEKAAEGIKAVGA
jgi:hypothetical protein